MNGSPELLHQAFAAAAADAAAKPQRQGSLIAIEGDETYITTMNGVSLRLQVTKPQNRWIVAAARHEGAVPPLSGVLDVFCQEIEGKPLQEAADHGAIYALERLRGDSPARPVPGILTPRSAGMAFTCCEKLIRSIVAEHSAMTGDRDTANFWNPPLSAEWRSKSDVERIATLQAITTKFSAARGLTPNALRVVEIDKTRRVIVEFGPEVSYLDKPEILMRLEMDIRQTTGDRLELFMAEAKDSNTIRRLTPDEEAAK